MALYALGDLHLHFQAAVRSMPMLQSPAWRGHEEKFRRNCLERITPRDTLVLLGDHSLGKKLGECEKDLEYIMSLPGQKVLLRGNHDQFWDVKKTSALNERFKDRLFFLQNNYFAYRDVALVGTKGYTFEGPFYLDRRGRITGWDEEEAVRAEALVARELERLRTSFEAARRDGYRRFLMFLHYPPTSVLEERSGFTEMAEEYGAEQVLYAHCHGASRFRDSLQGRVNGIEYRLLSGDYLLWQPMKLMI